MAKVGVDELDKSTTLESNKSHPELRLREAAKMRPSVTLIPGYLHF